MKVFEVAADGYLLPKIEYLQISFNKNVRLRHYMLSLHPVRKVFEIIPEEFPLSKLINFNYFPQVSHNKKLHFRVKDSHEIFVEILGVNTQMR